MALTIVQFNKTLLIEGNINASTVISFKNHIEHILNTRKELIIDVENLIEIDINGMKEFQTLYTNAKKNNKTIYMVGSGSEELQEYFNRNQP